MSDASSPRRTLSLRTVITLFVALAFLIGVLATWAWVQSDARWRLHQAEAKSAGVSLYAALQNGASLPGGITLSPLSIDDQNSAASGDFLKVSIAPQVVRTTIVPILPDATDGRTAQSLTLVILSPDIVYPLAGLQKREGQTAAETTGEVLSLLASYCSDPIVLAHVGLRPWQRVDGSDIWNCDAAPSDLRILAALGALIAMAVLLTLLQNTAQHFTSFAHALRDRRRMDGPTSYDSPGPQELQDIVASVNTHLEQERAQLEGRAAVLSGVSHDLGTPATRLRLRTALIEDRELRSKLESDIDSMTGMIESVLTYTRAEMNAETSRKISLPSLLDAIVADYEDTGHNVTLRPIEDVLVQGGQSVFMSRRGTSVVSGTRDVVVSARPISLERAICNLVDNALKYGRRATVGLETTSDSATIIVDDDGSDTSAQDIEALLAPFKRGDNTQAVDGYGLGLTIVSTIAGLHGGALAFEDHGSGLRARLSIRRI